MACIAVLYYQAEALTASTLLIAVSQSGRSAEIALLLDKASAAGSQVLGITNTLDSPLHQRSTSMRFCAANRSAPSPASSVWTA